MSYTCCRFYLFAQYKFYQIPVTIVYNTAYTDYTKSLSSLKIQTPILNHIMVFNPVTTLIVRNSRVEDKIHPYTKAPICLDHALSTCHIRTSATIIKWAQPSFLMGHRSKNVQISALTLGWHCCASDSSITMKHSSVTHALQFANKSVETQQCWINFSGWYIYL